VVHTPRTSRKFGPSRDAWGIKHKNKVTSLILALLANG